MFKIFIILLIISLIYFPVSAHTIWSIGKKDNSAAEFALSPKGYMDFLKNDFGWDDRSYIIGLSNEKKDWPYVLPGPADTWGGTSGTAGIRTHTLNILFRLSRPLNGSFKLVVDVLDAQDKTPPYLKVTVNGKSWKFAVPAGKNENSPEADVSQSLKYAIEIPLNNNDLPEGSNEVKITSLEGSWMVF